MRVLTKALTTCGKTMLEEHSPECPLDYSQKHSLEYSQLHLPQQITCCYGRFARTGRNGGLSILTAASAEPGVNETPETTAWETSRKIRLDWKEVKYCPAGVEI